MDHQDSSPDNWRMSAGNWRFGGMALVRYATCFRDKACQLRHGIGPGAANILQWAGGGYESLRPKKNPEFKAAEFARMFAQPTSDCRASGGSVRPDNRAGAGMYTDEL